MRTRLLFGAGVIAGLMAVGLALAVHGDAADGWLFAARWTARLSVLLFAIVFASGGLARILGGPARALIVHRRGLGLAFAAAHFVHLGALATWLAMSGTRPPTVTLAGGGLAYVLIAAMALTSTDAAQRRLGRWWKRLHLTGVWYVWLIFFQSYLGRVLEGVDRLPQGVFGVTILSAALALRLAPRLLRRPAAAARA
jgi:DMSO/TMAO reductase YedYZ heme-binding membrane subunit